ncbi:tetratricopeptide repeat protein [Paraburkholderia bannensis]|uniref:tetratricopeptide repeat protein n=1 Tax=Paraburkholderia bannensis TaxID=765414 RepID=UPI002AB71E95|nr:tetratricopeptide repeat protein [Paraburkholderia bannensis]
MNQPTQGSARRVNEDAMSLYKRGRDHYGRLDFELAETAFRRVTEIEPGWPQAKIALSSTLQKRSCNSEAESILRQALVEFPGDESVHNALALLLSETNRLEEAGEHYREAIRLNPDFYQAKNNLGVLLTNLDELQEAESVLRSGLASNENSHQMLSNLGRVLAHQGKPGEAIQAYRQALAISPDFAEAKLNLSHVLLALGEYEEGWSLYESRHDPAIGARITVAPPAIWPMWHGESLAGKSILVWPEQGFGDTIQFCRYASMLKSRGAERVSIACQPELQHLFKSLQDVDAVYALDGNGTIQRHDYWCYVMSLPHRFGSTLETIPGSPPYLRADAERISWWQERLPPGGLRVGLVWAGDPRRNTAAARTMDSRRSVSADAFLPILRVPDVTFVSLQKGEIARKQIFNLPPDLRPYDPMGLVADFRDTASIIASLDLVITVDSSVAHVAGALDKPVWILSRFDGCWRWLYDRDDSPWYPRARVFRQRESGDWASVIARVAHELQILRG